MSFFSFENFSANILVMYWLLFSHFFSLSSMPTKWMLEFLFQSSMSLNLSYFSLCIPLYYVLDVSCTALFYSGVLFWGESFVYLSYWGFFFYFSDCNLKNFVFHKYLFLKRDLFEREKRGRDRRRERISSRLPAEHRAPPGAWSHNPWGYDLSQNL